MCLLGIVQLYVAENFYNRTVHVIYYFVPGATDFSYHHERSDKNKVKNYRKGRIINVKSYPELLETINTRARFFQSIVTLTLKALITTAADDIHKYFFIVFQRK